MGMPTTLGLAAAAGASLSFGIGTILQYIGTRKHGATDGTGFQRFVGFTRHRVFAIGLVLDLVGFGLAALAVRHLPLFLVQAITTSSVGITALAASRLLRHRLLRWDWIALGGMVTGVTILAATAAPGHAHHLASSYQLLLLASVPAVSISVFVLDRKHRLSSAALGGLSGAAFGLAALAARLLTVPSSALLLVAQPLVWGAAAFTILGLVLVVAALDRGKPTAVSAASMTAETLLPAMIAVLLLGDRALPGLWPLAIAGFALTTSSALSLTLRRNTTEPDSIPAEASPALEYHGATQELHLL